MYAHTCIVGCTRVHTVVHIRAGAAVHVHAHTVIDFRDESRFLDDGEEDVVGKHRKQCQHALPAQRIYLCVNELVFVL
jgi:hypothetical protein